MAVSPQEPGEAFAADRTRISRDPGSLPPLPQTGGIPLDASISRSVRGEAALNPRPESDGGPDEFPIPFAISGKKPKLATGSSTIPPPVVKPTAPRTPPTPPKGQETSVDSDEMADPAAKKKPAQAAEARSVDPRKGAPATEPEPIVEAHATFQFEAF